jgi:phage anti-repressor protein
MYFSIFLYFNNNEKSFNINLDKIANWLEIRKDNLKVLLESNFNEDEDYIIETNKLDGKGKGKGGNNKKNIILSYICAKMLCMISKTSKANDIRKYYFDLEKLIMIYYNEKNI